MAGMISTRRRLPNDGSSRDLQEVGVHAEASIAALLGVELRRDNVVAGDDRCEVHAVFGLADHNGWIRGLRIVRVYEVEVRAVGDTIEYWVRPDDSHLVPAHVGHLETVGEADDAAGQDSEALVLAS